MPYIITITGPSGAGKSSTLFYLLEEKRTYFDPVLVPKYTNRPEHKDDRGEIHREPDMLAQCDLKYIQYGDCYGIALNTIWEHIMDKKSPIVILNDVRAVEDVKKMFGGIVRSLFIFRESPNEVRFQEIATAKGLDPKEIKPRLQKAQTLYRIYIENIHIFDHVIINSSTLPDLRLQVKKIVDNLQQSQKWPLVERIGE
jgi:guanylate kinase